MKRLRAPGTAAAYLLTAVTFAMAGSQGTITVLDGNGTPQSYGVHIDNSGHYRQLLAPENATTTNGSVKITAGGTFQTIISAAASGARLALTIQNNQISGTDVCYLLFGANIDSQINPGTTLLSSNFTINSATISAGGAALVLNPGQAYTRYYPMVPSDAFYATCSTTGDTVYVDTQ